ncbi:MAG: hypothetical protein L0I24_13770, partial [Pseudonocardia sp.]|nr:hypothetical protein [Pseudonocardia sp.]
QRTAEQIVEPESEVILPFSCSTISGQQTRHFRSNWPAGSWRRGDLDAAVATDLGCTDAQLLLSWAISTCLRRPHSPLSEPDARPVLLACAAGE